MRVLIILEDPTLDQYIVKPIVERMMRELGRSARVDVLWDPWLSGIDHALDEGTIRDIVTDHPMVDVFILVVDRDCDRIANEARVAQRGADHGGKLIGCLAREEVEVWMLALYGRLPVSWKVLRAECDPKERYAEPFLAGRGWSMDVGRGRKRAMEALAGNWKRLVSRCPEIRDLQQRVASRP